MVEKIAAPARPELDEDYRVFFVTAWGYAADHLFGWFPKALNSHRDMFVLLSHEGARPKYFMERTRAERPAIQPFTEFLNDMGMTYSAIGDCISYRAGQIPALRADPRYADIPVVNLLRHPIPWLEFYVRWRATNMRMRSGSSAPLEWEWRVANHAYFEYLDLEPYAKDDIPVWSSYQGMYQLNSVIGDVKCVERQVPVESVADDEQVFLDLVKYLTKDRVQFDRNDLDRAYSMRHTLFRGEHPVETDPRTLAESWPGWKVDAFRKVVSREAVATFKQFGYHFYGIEHTDQIAVPRADRVFRPVFVSTLMKSGTELLSEIIERMTGLRRFEPPVDPKTPPNYSDSEAIEFPSGHFFCWHSTIVDRAEARLRGAESRNILLVRNIYDTILAIRRHLVEDVDAGYGRSVLGSDYFAGKSIEETLTLIIAGFAHPRMSWPGMGPIFEQMASMLRLAETGHAFLVTYEELTGQKLKTVERLSRYLHFPIPAAKIAEIVAATAPDAMRARLAQTGQGAHVTRTEERLSRSEFQPYHIDIIEALIKKAGSDLRDRFKALGFPGLFSIDG